MLLIQFAPTNIVEHTPAEYAAVALLLVIVFSAIVWVYHTEIAETCISILQSYRRFSAYLKFRHGEGGSHGKPYTIALIDANKYTSIFTCDPPSDAPPEKRDTPIQDTNDMTTQYHLLNAKRYLLRKMKITGHYNHVVETNFSKIANKRYYLDISKIAVIQNASMLYQANAPVPGSAKEMPKTMFVIFFYEQQIDRRNKSPYSHKIINRLLCTLEDPQMAKQYDADLCFQTIANIGWDNNNAYSSQETTEANRPPYLLHVEEPEI